MPRMKAPAALLAVTLAASAGAQNAVHQPLVKAGPYRLCWRVNAGLYGKARAVNAGVGGPIKGEFQGVISNVAPKARVNDQGQVVESQGPGTGKKNNSEGQ